MRYDRLNGRFAGRVRGPGRGVSFELEGGYAFGGIADAGTGPPIAGDATTALIAQVNRFRDRHGQSAFQLATGTVPAAVAVAAIGILQARLTAATIRSPDTSSTTELQALSRAYGDPVGYVQPRRDVIAKTIALYGDSLGLPVAKVGITPPSSLLTKAVVIGGVAVLAALLFAR